MVGESALHSKMTFLMCFYIPLSFLMCFYIPLSFQEFCGFSFHLRIFFIYMNMSPLLVKDFIFWPRHGTHAFEQWEFFSLLRLMWYGTSIHNSHLSRTRDTHTSCQALGSWALITCFNNLGLSRLGFEHPIFRMQSECSNQLHICWGCITIFFNKDKRKFLTGWYVSYTCFVAVSSVY